MIYAGSRLANRRSFSFAYFLPSRPDILAPRANPTIARRCRTQRTTNHRGTPLQLIEGGLVASRPWHLPVGLERALDGGRRRRALPETRLLSRLASGRGDQDSPVATDPPPPRDMPRPLSTSDGISSESVEETPSRAWPTLHEGEQWSGCSYKDPHPRLRRIRAPRGPSPNDPRH